MKINDFKQFNESAMTCSECGGPAFSDLILAEKQDACYNKVKSRYKVWPSAYASGALVQCRKKGAANWGNKSEGVAENKQPGKPVVDAILKVMPLAQEIWFHGSRAIGQHRNDSDTDILVVVPDDLVGDKYLGVVRILQKLSSHFDNHDIQPTKAGTNIHRIAQEEGRLLWSKNQGVAEGASDFVGDSIEALRSSVPGLKQPDFLDELYMYIENQYGQRAAEMMANAGQDDFDDWYDSYLDKPEQGVMEGSEQIDELSPETLKSYANKARAQVRASPGANPNNSHLPTDPKIANRARGAVKADNRLHGFGPAKKSTQGVAEGQHSPVAQAITRRILMQRTDLLAKYGPGYVGQAIDDVVDSVGDVEEIGSSDVSGWVRQVEHNLKNKLNQYDEPMNVGNALDEDYNAEYDDEAGMADNNLETLSRAVEGIDELIQSGDNLPEWCQEKIAVAKSMLVAVWDYMHSEESSDEMDPEVDEMFEAMDQLAEEIAARDNIDVDLVWESFESLDDHMLYETAAWRRKEGKSKTGGLNAKGVASYRRENPGSKLQTAVTTKPSKLKKGSKAAKRRKSFCARMSGVKGPMKKPNGKPTRKALALRKWNC